MCGFTGLLSLKMQYNIKELVSKMTSSLIHRGPDDKGVWFEGPIGLGHRRLSIVDLSFAGAQPMESDCKRFILAYNGEIYNHIEMRYALEKEGGAPKWRGHSDTETLLAAISHWGLEKALLRCHGMFALALWNK